MDPAGREFCLDNRERLQTTNGTISFDGGGGVGTLIVRWLADRAHEKIDPTTRSRGPGSFEYAAAS